MTDRPFSLYVHVPFCAQKCPYCDFNTYATNAIPEDSYVAALCSELDIFAKDPRFSGRRTATIFFGGGTPSLLSPAAIGKVISHASRLFPVLPHAEITIEANPNVSTVDTFLRLLDVGVTRISFGVQSFSNERLRLLGRDHSPEQASEAIQSAVTAGISNVSLDLIFGVPGQTVEDLEQDIARALKLPITHLSTYTLTIEPGTPFFQRQERGLLTMPNDTLVAQMLERVPAILEPLGFKRYEISNYAKPSYESAHNRVYWMGGDYLGIGAGAHSYVAHYESDLLIAADRWSTLALPQSYMKAISEGGAISWRERLDPQALQFEFLYLGLRMTQGIDAKRFATLFNRSLWDAYGVALRDLSSEGFLLLEGDSVRLTSQGVSLADSVFERFVNSA